MMTTTSYISRSRFTNLLRLTPGTATLCGQNSITVQLCTEDKLNKRLRAPGAL